MSRLLRLPLALLLALFLSGPVVAQQAEIESTIQGQFDAFLQDDVETAFTFASPMIRYMFQSPENFGNMVRNGYPMVWRPADVTYLDLREQDGQLVQRVQVRDAAGQLHWLDYTMLETKNGWQINGVQYVQMPGVGA